MKRAWILHPLLGAAFPILFLYAHNAYQTPVADVALPLILSLLMACVLWAALALATRSAAAGALITTLFLVLFHSYGRLFTFSKHLVIGTIFLGRNRIFALVFLAILALGSAFFIRSRGQPRLAALTRIANRFGICMVAISLAQIAFFHVTQKHVRPPYSGEVPPAARANSPMPGAMAADSSGTGKPLPDIYYIIPDSYEADASLLDFFRYDNSPFTGSLRKKGFFIADKSTANYGFTLPSLASSLNMGMLDALESEMGRRSTDKTPLSAMIENNKVMGFLKSKGYTVINSGSWWGPTFQNKSADINLHANRFNEFTLKVLEGTPLLSVMEEITEMDLRAKTLYAFDNLIEIPYLKEPTFTLVHLICPHPPFVFGAQGEKVSTLSRIRAKTAPRKYYLDQLRFINMKLEKAVDEILARSATPPIIIIQGDHGAAYIQASPIYVDAMPDQTYSREQMRILNALYLPGAEPGLIPADLTPVNTFRLVFNRYFGTDLPMVANRNLYSNQVLPYSFMDVTAKVAYPDGE
jgi:hypothetical protein